MWSDLSLRQARRAVADGDRLLGTGAPADAAARYAKALHKIGDASTAPEQARTVAAGAHIGLGRLAIAGNDLRAASAEFDRACALTPQDWRGFYWAGVAAGHAGDYRTADWQFTAALTRWPTLGDVYRQRAYVRLRLGATVAALADFSDAGRQLALDENALLVLASVHIEREEWDPAEWALRALPEGRRPPLADALLGLVLHRQDREAEALAAYGRAIARNVTAPPVLFNHGLLAYRLGRFDESIRSWTRLCQRHPMGERYRFLVARAHYAAGRQLAGAGEYAAAADHLAAGADAVPDTDLGRALTVLRVRAAAQAVRDGDRDRALSQLALISTAEADREPMVSHLSALLVAADGDAATAVADWRRLVEHWPAQSQGRLAVTLVDPDRTDPDRERSLAELADEHGAAPVGRQATHALAALLVRREDWAGAARVLAELPADDPVRTAVLAECFYRSEKPDPHDPDDLARFGTWLVAIDAADGEPATGMAELAVGNVPERLRRELGLLLRGLALTEAAASNWATAATLLTAQPLPGPAEPGVFAALVLLLGGRRGEGLAALVERCRANPFDHRRTHVLAAALLHTLGLATPPAPATWARCVAAWIAVLYADPFWTDTLADARERYLAPVAEDVVDGLRTGVRELLAARIPADDRAQLLLAREIAAAELLVEYGTFPAFGDGVLVCGPMWLAEVGLAGEFGGLVAELTDEDAGLRLEMRRCFSALGVGYHLLRADRPADALAELVDLRCPVCAGRPDTATPVPPGPFRPLVCASDCTEFDAHNPAYAGLANGRSRLSEDAVELAIGGVVALGRAELAREEPNPGPLAEHWRTALVAAQSIGAQEELRDELAKQALARAGVLTKKENYPAAADVLLTAHGVLDEAGRARLAAKLASALTDRGVVTFNKDRTAVAASIADLRRALTYQPQLIRARTSLAVMLREQSAQHLARGAAIESVSALRQVVELMNESITLLGEQQKLVELRDQSIQDIEYQLRRNTVEGRTR